LPIGEGHGAKSSDGAKRIKIATTPKTNAGQGVQEIDERFARGPASDKAEAEQKTDEQALVKFSPR